MPDIIAIGGGQASFSFINKLRLLGYKKSVTLICGENFLPYQRPPLSKKFLIGDFEKERLFLKPQSFYDENNIEVIKGQKVQEIDRKNSKVSLDNGQELEYNKLFLGLGSKPRLLPQMLINGISDIYYIRNIGDVDLIINKFLSKRKILILGGGFIGLEVASVARKLGIKVTLIESEERILKLRCVEGWSMVIPWLGFSLSELLNKVQIKSNAKFVEFETIYNPEEMVGQRYPILNWPYIEGLRIDEAMHPLTTVVTGLYGKSLPNQNGAPLRIFIPWKYGFKSAKSIVKIKLTKSMPNTAWKNASPREYGFYSNVNPEVDHPRWSQKTERVIGESILAPRIKTLMFNGYGDEVAHLYSGMDLKKNY